MDVLRIRIFALRIIACPRMYLAKSKIFLSLRREEKKKPFPIRTKVCITSLYLKALRSLQYITRPGAHLRARVCEVVGDLRAKCEATGPPMRTPASYFSLRSTRTGAPGAGMRSNGLYFTFYRDVYRYLFRDTVALARDKVAPRRSQSPRGSFANSRRNSR